MDHNNMGHNHHNMSQNHGNMSQNHGNMSQNHGNMGQNHGNMNHNMDNMNHEMLMYFHSSTMVTLFFKDWMTMNQKEFTIACIGLFIVAIFVEGLKILRQVISVRQWEKWRSTKVVHVETNKGGTLYKEKNVQKTSFKVRIVVHLIQTLLYVIQIFLGYILMLAVMTYNTLIFVAIVLGYGTGYMLFAWLTPLIKLSDSTSMDDGECCNL